MNYSVISPLKTLHVVRYATVEGALERGTQTNRIFGGEVCMKEAKKIAG